MNNKSPLRRTEGTISLFPEPPCLIVINNSMISISQPNSNQGEFSDNVLTIPTGQWSLLRNHIEAMLEQKRWKL